MYDSMVPAESSTAGSQLSRADVAVTSDTWTFVGAFGMATNTNKTVSYFTMPVKVLIAVNGSIRWHSYGVSLAIWDDTVLPANRHKWTHPALTPAIQAGTRFTYHGGIKGWVDLVDLIAPRPGVEPATFRSRIQRSTNATTKTTSDGDGLGARAPTKALSPQRMLRVH